MEPGLPPALRLPQGGAVGLPSTVSRMSECICLAQTDRGGPLKYRSSSVVLSASPGNVLEMQFLWPHDRPTEPETLGLGQQLYSNESSR